MLCVGSSMQTIKPENILCRTFKPNRMCLCFSDLDRAFNSLQEGAKGSVIPFLCYAWYH